MDYRHAVGVLLAALVILQSCAHNREQAKRQDLQRGEELRQKGHFAEAEIQFRKALQEDPRYGEAYLALGRTEARLGRYSLAFGALRQAVADMPGQDAPEIELGNLLLVAYLGNPSHPAELYTQISHISDELLTRDSDSFDGIRFKGFLATADSDPQKAVEYFEKANRLRPDRPDIITAWCESLMRAWNRDRAETIARAFLNKRPDYGPLYSMLYEYYAQAGRMQDAESILKSKVARNPKESLYRIELARHYAKAGKSAELSQVLNELTGNPGAFPRADLEIGDFFMDAANLTEARRYYTEGAQRDPKSKVLYWKRLVRVDLAANDRSAAERTIEQILKEQPDDAETQASRSALRLATNDSGQIALAISELKALISRKPEVVEYRFQYAEALRLDGQTELARREYLEVVQRQPANRAALQTLADLSIRGQHLDEALTYAGRILAMDPGNVRASLVRSAALAAKGESVEARGVLKDLAKQHPQIREAQLQLALLDVAEKHYSEAEAHFRQLYMPGKDDVRALEGLVEVYRAQNQLDRAEVLLKSDLEKSPHSSEVRALLAKTAAQAGDNDLAVAEYEQLAHVLTQSPAIAVGLGLALQARSDLLHAVAEFERARKLAPKSALVLAYLGRAQEDLGRKTDAITSYRQSLAFDKRNPWVMNNLAYLLADSGGDLNEAMIFAQDAVRADPNNTSFSDTVGLIYLKKKDLPSAAHVFQGLKEKSPKDVNLRIHFSQTLLASGDTSQARSELEAALALPATPDERATIKKLMGDVEHER
jgi:tetratricopeptide (TPR) repeat protein